MKIQLQRFKKIAVKRTRSMDMKNLAKCVLELPRLSKSATVGDCIETDRFPEDVRRYITYPLGVKVRQVGITKWRIWLIDSNA